MIYAWDFPEMNDSQSYKAMTIKIVVIDDERTVN